MLNVIYVSLVYASLSEYNKNISNIDVIYELQSGSMYNIYQIIMLFAKHQHVFIMFIV